MMLRITKKRSISVMSFVVALAILFSFTACNGNNGNTSGNNGDTSEYSKYASTVTINIGLNRPGGAWDMVNNPLNDLALNVLNIKVTGAWDLSWAEHVDKVKLAVATKSLPDACVVYDYDLVKQMAKAGMLADLTSTQKYFGKTLKEVYSSYPNNAVLNDVTFDGKLYAIPSTGLRAQNSMLWVRKDWMENLGLGEPKTVEDVFKIAEAFVKNDPDKNGKNDTIGLPFNRWVWGAQNAHSSLDPILAAYGAFPTAFFKDSNGKVIYGSTQPEMKIALAAIAKQVSAGNISPTTDGTAELASGKCGMMFGPWWEPSGYLKASRDADSNADWVCFNAPLNSAGKYTIVEPAPTNPNAGYVVVKAGFSNPEAVVKLINLYYDGIYNEDADILAKYKGDKESLPTFGSAPLNIQLASRDVVFENYKKITAYLESGNFKDAKPSDIKTVQDIKAWQSDPTSIDSTAWSKVLSVMVGSKIVNNSEIEYKTPCIYFLPSEAKAKFTSLLEYENSIFFRIIAEKGASIDLFDTYVTQWKSIGGDAVISAVQDLVK